METKNFEQLFKDWLRLNPNFSNQLRDEQGLFNTLIRNNPFHIRDNKLVSAETNEVHDLGAFIQSHARPFLKTIGSGRYLGKYRDQRTSAETEAMQRETKQMLETFLEKKGYAFINSEPARVWVDQLSKNMVYESDNNGGFVLTALLNGVPTKKHNPDELFNLIGSYVDPEKTRLNNLRRDAKISQEALSLSGFTTHDLADKRKESYYQEIESLLKKEFHGQPTTKRLPNIPQSDLIDDLSKEVAHAWSLPLERKDWSLAEKTTIKAVAENTIAEVENNAIQPIKNLVANRPASFYRGVVDSYSGLPTEKDI